jgi:hypothetical protein
MSDILKLDSVSQIHELAGLDEPVHPLISFFRPSHAKRESVAFVMKKQVLLGLYSINLKDGHECEILYGRKPYGFQKGTIMFLGPNQTIMPMKPLMRLSLSVFCICWRTRTLSSEKSILS